MRFRRRLAAAGLLGLAAALACSPPKTAAPAPEVDPSLRPFLLDPAADCGSPTPESAAGLRAAYQKLLLTSDASAVLRDANRAIEHDATALAPRALRAQALLVAAQPREAVKLSSPIGARAADCLPLALVLGRALEEVGEVPEAYATYFLVAERSPTAAERTRKLSAPAQEAIRGRFSSGLSAGRREAAQWHLSQLARYWPNSEVALQSAMDWARATDDLRSELAAVKGLQAMHPRDPALTLRRGQLELEFGDPRQGLALVESAAAAAPADAAIQTELARAKFTWRLLNAPEQVRGVRDKVVLTRAEFAVLLYWMVPQIRTARPGAAQIASDIVDHPSRDEIARVANLGLMTIDETLHRFSPDAGMRRSDAVAALLRLLSDAGDAASCGPARAAGREAACQAGVACGLFEDPSLCQAGGGLSGAEAIEMLRRTLDRLGDG